MRKLATEFSPLTPKQERNVQNGSAIRADLATLLRKHCPDASFLKLYDITAPVPIQIHDRNTVPVPSSPLQLARNLTKNEGSEASPEMLLEQMALSSEQCASLAEHTAEQANCTEWREQRRGRCTASNSKRVYTRCKTIVKNPRADLKPLMTTLLGYKDVRPTRAMKHGLSMEPEAKRKFHSLMKNDNTHTRFTHTDTGLHVMKEHPFIAASPDLLTHCECHGDGICEITCPVMFDNEFTPDNYHHLQYATNTSLMLSHTSEYYYQLQHLMGVTGRHTSYIFIYTPKTFHLEQITFDEELWNDMVEKFTLLWLTHVAPEMLSGSLIAEQDVVSHHNYCVASTASTSTSTPKITRPRVKSLLKHPIYFL